MTLLELKQKTKAIVQAITAQDKQKERLHALGISLGAAIEKVHETTPVGPIVICTPQRCNIAIGHDLAGQIEVTCVGSYDEKI